MASSIVFLNGKFLPEHLAKVSAFDRGFLYGDGIFETLRLVGGEPVLWDEHIRRFETGLRLLNITKPYSRPKLRSLVARLVTLNDQPDSLLRITISRGVGVRGYSPEGATHPTFMLSLHPSPAVLPGHPPAWRMITASQTLPTHSPIAAAKTANKLIQVLARAEALDAGVEEALLLNAAGEVVEACAANLFWISEGRICTAPLASGAHPGITRSIVAELAGPLGIAVRETTLLRPELFIADAVFLTLSSWGIVEVIELDRCPMRRSPIVPALHQAWCSEIRLLALQN